MLNLTTIIALLFAGSAAVFAFGYRKPQRTHSAALAVTVLFLVLWPFLLGQIPTSYATASEIEGGFQTVFQWQLDETSWLLSLSLLLLQFAALLTIRSSERQIACPLLILVLTSALHLAFWAASPAAIVLSWMILLALWLSATWLLRRDAQSQSQRRSQAIVAVAGLLFLWWAAAGADATAVAEGLQIATWSTAARALALVAVTVQLILVPFYLWRTFSGVPQGTLGGLVFTAPVAAGAMLLARLEGASNIGLSFALPLSLLGLLGLLLACWQIWSEEAQQWRLASALIIAQASLILLAGVWAGPQAVLAETRVLLLGSGLLFLASFEEQDSTQLQYVGPLLALAALLGLPLTAGFSGRSALYQAWLDEGRWLLLLVAALLHTLIAMAVSLFFLKRRRWLRGKRPQLTPVTLLPLGGSLFPALALLSVDRLPATPPLAWVAILLPIIGGALLAYFVGDLAQLRPALREAFSINLPGAPASQARRVAPRLGQAIREAASILESEGGLLWLLLFLVILWLAR